ncbi:MAG: A/G-specific adenine glycosylase [Anaeroplasmataceae bacterium]|nr:A/G-specific adenine glycosylase [Anaeroplasmataceae bacterium]
MKDEVVIMKEIVLPLLEWFEENKRDLDWRKNRTPYTILVSEVMLQQTRVEAVRSYFKRFIEELPDFKSLANCPDGKLMKLWEGLGYYSRARNLKKCAIEIVEKYNGIFPNTYEQAIKLSGVGAYTCGAVLSLGYNLKYAAVDGNVLRVLSRCTASSLDISLEKTKLHFKQEIEKIMPNAAGTFNESLMELGATICMPKIARCDVCPLKKNCKAYHQENQLSYPVKARPKEKKILEYTCLFITDGKNYILIPKEKDLLQGLPSPILIDHFITSYEAIEALEDLGFYVKNVEQLSDQKHIFTHQIWYMKGYKVYVEDLLDYPNYTKEQILDELGVSSCFKKFFEDVWN